MEDLHSHFTSVDGGERERERENFVIRSERATGVRLKWLVMAIGWRGPPSNRHTPYCTTTTVNRDRQCPTTTTTSLNSFSLAILE